MRNTVIVALLLGMVLNLIQVLFDYLNENTALDEEIEAIITISHTPASQIAYNIDSRLAEELLEGLLKHPSIIEADIVDTDNRTLARRERNITESPYRWMSDLLFNPTRTYTTRLAVQQLVDVDLGNLNVVVDTYQAGIAFLKRAGFTLLSGFIKSLSLSFLLLFVFYLMLTKPLVDVIEAIIQVAPDTPEKARLPVPKGHENDEIGVLVESTNDHLQAIERSLLKIRQAEARLKTYSEQLEQIVEARTRELSDKNDQLLKSNRELVVAKEEAVKRAKARADFLANMSHEIRTPFNGVLGMISLTLEEPLSERQSGQLEVAYNSGVALLQVLNDILDISKVEAGKLTLESISFDLRKTVDEVASLLAQNSAARNIELATYIQPNFPEHIFGDPTRIRQVISNLVGNAIKFTEEGRVTLSLRCDERMAIIKVVDTGIGISDSALQKIFSPFSQAYSDTTRKYGGTGLGLTLCKQLVQHMSGTLTVESEENVGSTFTVTIPLREDISHTEKPVSSGMQKSHFQLLHKADNVLFDFIKDQIRHWNLPITEHIYSSNIESVDMSKISTSDNDILIIDDPAFIEKIGNIEVAAKILLINRLHRTLSPDSPLRKLTHGTLSGPFGRAALKEAIGKLLGDESGKALSGKARTLDAANNNYTVLLVEDNQVNQMVAKTILKKLGYTVKIAGNGQEAVNMIKADKFDVVLMDCHMPIMDGYEATRYIRNELNIQNLPIIAVTANVMHGDKEKCFNAGMNDYVTKPYERHVLIEKLEHWVRKGGNLSNENPVS
ncbi:MAG: response regulator [Hahellaceae bacterium]|jgi:signal transduction histidine kinase/ActR/RegA family two-component response regulator|nr:response regulator [Hahellaceae bacterium]MCP5212914.1 response regulator [Hahellaceae bacterium]